VSWKNPEPKVRATLALATDPGFTKIVRSIEIAGESASVGALDPGIYFWKVTARTAEGESLPESLVSSFTVAPIPLFAAPIVTAPLPASIIDMRSADSILFRWNKVEGATHYQLGLSSARSGATLWGPERVVGNEFRFEALETLDIGDFVFAVKAQSYDRAGALERQGRPAELRFSVTLSRSPSSPPILITPRTIYVP
jgi:hypothetical protein